MNSVNLIGYIKRIKIFDSSASITLSVKYDKDKTDYLPVKAFGRTVDIIKEFLNEGDLIGVNGRLASNKY